MQVRSINNTTSFGTVSWGTEEEKNKTLHALEAVKQSNLDGYDCVDFNKVLKQISDIAECEDEVIITAKVDDDNTRLFTLKSINPKNHNTISRFQLGLKSPTRPMTSRNIQLEEFAEKTIKLISLFNQDKDFVKFFMDTIAD